MKTLFTGSKSTGSDARRTRWGVLGSSLAALALLAAPLAIEIGSNGASGLIGSAEAAPRLCDDGSRPPCDDGGGGGGAAPDFGDLIFLLRDVNGVPVPSDEVQVVDPETNQLVDGGLCQQPIAFNVPDEEEDPVVCPDSCVVDTTDPDTVSVDPLNCGVTAGCEGCTQEVEFGRINEARSPDEVFESQVEDVVVNLATADCTTLDPAGRLVATRVDADLSVLISTIDSPLQNLAIYRQLMLTGFLGAETNPIELPGAPDPHTVFDTAARGLGAASDKAGEVNVDLVHYLNSIMGLSDPLTPTFIGKLCETYREEVQGVVQLVEKCFLNYGSDLSNIEPAGADYTYNRSDNFSTTTDSLPFPAYIPDATAFGGFEYLTVLDPTVPSFTIVQGPILDAVFGTDLGFLDGNIGGFAQASDDARAVISFMHENQVPIDFETPVPCEAVPGDNYDVAISEESGLQVPVTYINGTEREFIVTVQNLSVSPAAATGTVTVTAETLTGAPIPGSPWVFNFAELAPGFSEAFVQPLQFDLGNSTTVSWTATVDAPLDVNPLNNTVTATTNVRNTGGGGGGGGQGGNPNN